MVVVLRTHINVNGKTIDELNGINLLALYLISTLLGVIIVCDLLSLVV